VNKTPIPDKALWDQIKKRIQREMADRERQAVDYWKRELEKIYRRRHEGLAPLLVEMKGLLERMENRIRILKREAEG
jgi:hypothetical protein